MLRTYIRLFFGLLIPLSGLFIVLSIFYFKIDYNFTKAIKLGVLTGISLGLALSAVLALFLTIKRIVEQYRYKAQTEEIEEIQKSKKKSKKVSDSTKTDSRQNKANTDTTVENKTNLFTAQKIMLLMDKELAFEVAHHAIKQLKIGKMHSKDKSKGSMYIQNKKEKIHILITSLTKHSAQLEIQSEKSTQVLKKLITYIKEKEYAFLEY